MRLVSNLLIVCIFCFCQNKLSAQKTLSLNECIETALRVNIDLQTQNIKINQSTENYKNLNQSRFPSVSANISQNLTAGRSIDPFTNAFVQRGFGSNSFGLSSSLNLFDAFTYKIKLAQGKNETETQKTRLDIKQKDLKINVTEAYMRILLAQELLKISQEQKNDLDAQLLIVKEKVKEGLLPKSQILDFEAQVSNQEFEVFSAKNNLDLSKLSLSQWLGSAKILTFETKFEKPIPLMNFEFNVSHPSLKILEGGVKGANISYKLAETSKYPKLNLNGGLSTAYSSAAGAEFSYFKQLNFNFNQYLGLGLNIPIYSNGQVRNAIFNARSQELIARKELEAEKLRLNQDFEKQLLEIDLLSEKVKLAESNLKTQEKVYLAGKERFKEGLISSLELNVFRLNLEKAKINLSQSQIEHSFKSKMLELFLE